MSNVTIYSSNRCPFCVKAKMLLDKKNIEYEEIDVTDNEEARKKLVEKANGMRTVPQIFIGETHVGGCDDLYELENNGKLDPMLTA